MSKKLPPLLALPSLVFTSANIMRGMRRIFSLKEAERKVQIKVNVEHEQASNDFVRLRWLVIVGRRRQSLSPSFNLACDLGDGNWKPHRLAALAWPEAVLRRLTKYLWPPRLLLIDLSLQYISYSIAEVLQSAV